MHQIVGGDSSSRYVSPRRIDAVFGFFYFKSIRVRPMAGMKHRRVVDHDTSGVPLGAIKHFERPEFVCGLC
jgi:hypothetical protein